MTPGANREMRFPSTGGKIVRIISSTRPSFSMTLTMLSRVIAPLNDARWMMKKSWPVRIILAIPRWINGEPKKKKKKKKRNPDPLGTGW